MGGAIGSAGALGAMSGADYGALDQAPDTAIQPAPASSFGQFLSKVNSGAQDQQTVMSGMGGNPGADALKSGASTMLTGGLKKDDKGGGKGGGIMGMLPMLAALKDGGMVKVVVSPGEKVVPPNKVEKAAGGKVDGWTVPGKAKVPGDSLKNDVVETKLPEGSIVVKRTKAGNDRDAANFVRSTLAKRGRK